MTVHVSTDWTYRGLRAVVLENELLRIDLFPEAGAKIYNFVYKPADHNFLWHHPRIDLAAVPLGLPYDDHFSGGWDELFPNDAATMFRGNDWPDHGELWSRSWECRVLTETPDEVVVYLRLRGAVTSMIVEKWLTLRKGESKLRFRHRISNVGREPAEFLWKLHPALAVTEHHRVDVPGRRGEYVGPGWSRLADATMNFDWPLARNAAGETADLRRVLPATSGKRDFVYVSELEAGWCALTDTRKELGIGLVFPRDVFPYVWLFMPAGGWRDIQTVILEPCTSYPKDIELAAANKTLAHLEPGACLECDVIATVYSGMRGVASIDRDGNATSASD